MQLEVLVSGLAAVLSVQSSDTGVLLQTVKDLTQVTADTTRDLCTAHPMRYTLLASLMIQFIGEHGPCHSCELHILL